MLTGATLFVPEQCESADFYFALLLSLVMIAIIPVGVPLSFYYVMGKAKSKLPGGRVSTTLLGGAKLIAQEEDMGGKHLFQTTCQFFANVNPDM